MTARGHQDGASPSSPSSAPEAADAAQLIGRLMIFYDVKTIDALVAVQAYHIERLQARLPKIEDKFPGSYRRG